MQVTAPTLTPSSLMRAEDALMLAEDATTKPGPDIDARAQPRVLVVEDDHEMRGMLSDFLDASGYQVIEAASGAEAIELVLQRWGCTGPLEPSFDLIITDVRMSGFSGLDLLELVRTARLKAPVIVITAFGAADVHAEAIRLGAVATFDKPFDLDRLAETARALTTGS